MTWAEEALSWYWICAHRWGMAMNLARHLWICLRQGRIRVHYRDEDTWWMVGRKGRVSYVTPLTGPDRRQWSKRSPVVLALQAQSGQVREWDPRQQMGVGL